MIKSGDWADLTDDKFLGCIKELRQKTSTTHLRDKCASLLERKLPKVVYEHSTFQEKGNNKKDGMAVNTAVSRVEGVMNDFIAGHSVSEATNVPQLPAEYWRISYASMPFTKVDPREDVGNETDEKRSSEERAGDHAVRILSQSNRVLDDEEQEKHSLSSQLIVDDQLSVMSLLAHVERHVWRLYVLFPSKGQEGPLYEARIEAQRAEIESAIKAALKDYTPY